MTTPTTLYRLFDAQGALLYVGVAGNAAADREFASDSLVGSFFHSTDPPGWQGCVVAEPQPGLYLVELFSWFMGDSTEQVLVPVGQMTGWQFYDTAEWMTNVYEHGLKQRWEIARKERSEGARDDGLS